MRTSRPRTGPAAAGWPMMERSVLSGVLGLPGYAAIGIALGFTGLGVFIDLERISGLGAVFTSCYVAGCVLAVCWVKRRALFGPMVQPPLLMAVAVPAVVLAAGGLGGGPLGAPLLAIATPLLNGFPPMAVTTAVVLAVGIGRYLRQRPPGELEPRADVVPRRPTERAPGAAVRAPGAAARAPGAADLAPAEREHPPPERAPSAGRAPDPSEEPTTVLPPHDADPDPPRRPALGSELPRARQRPI